jgi:hypothetical protein
MGISETSIRRVEEMSGEANVYIDVTLPADGAELDLGAGGVPASGTFVGVTSEAATIGFDETVKGKKVQQAGGEIAHKITEEGVDIEVTMAEAYYQTLAWALNGATTGATPAKTTHWVKGGGRTRVQPRSVVLVSPIENPDGSFRYQWFMLYKAVPEGKPKLKYDRGETREIAVTFKGVFDLTRTKGDQLYQYIETDAPAA